MVSRQAVRRTKKYRLRCIYLTDYVIQITAKYICVAVSCAHTVTRVSDAAVAIADAPSASSRPCHGAVHCQVDWIVTANKKEKKFSERNEVTETVFAMY